MVTSVDLSRRPFVITTNRSAFTAHTVVISTGADSRWLGVPGEEELKAQKQTIAVARTKKRRTKQVANRRVVRRNLAKRAPKQWRTPPAKEHQKESQQPFFPCVATPFLPSVKK